MSMTTPIVDFVQNYAKSGTSRLHMPGHKGQALLGFEGLDITEIRGADELYEADGGAWKLEAKRNIAAYLGEKLADLIESGNVVVMI